MKIGIVGGGIAGLSAAICLSKIGIEIEVFERASEIRELGAGVNLWPNATRVLAQMGLLQQCLEKSMPLSFLELRNLQGRILLKTKIDQGASPVICMRRSDLLAILHAEVSDQSIYLRHNCNKISTAGSKVTVQCEGQKARFFDGVIGADGARSRVRSYVTGLLIEPMYRGYTIWRGVCPFDLRGNALNTIQEIWGSGRRFGVLPMGPNSLCWYATDTRAKAENASADHDKLELLRLFRDWPNQIPEIIQATLSHDILKHGAADLDFQRSWFRNKVAIIGDAAHPLTPNIGQGCCLALEDSFLISQALKQTGEVESAFEFFDRTRRKRVESIVKMTRWIGSIGQFRIRPAVFIRDNMLPRFSSMAFELGVRPILF